MAAPMEELDRCFRFPSQTSKMVRTSESHWDNSKSTYSQFTVTSESSVIQEVLANLSLAQYILYVKQHRSCEDLCIFDNEGRFLISYEQEKQKTARNNNTELDLSNWGNEVFGFLPAVKIPSKSCDNHVNTQQSLTASSFDSRRHIVHISQTYHQVLEAQVAGGIVRLCQISPQFLINFCHNTEQNAGRRKICVRNEPSAQGTGKVKSTTIPKGIIIHLREASHFKIDHAWDERIQHLVGKKGVLDDAMSWLNTLGGGYSALGDYFKDHAERAGRISVQQLRVAVNMGDPPTIIRCHLYFSLSIMQCGHLRHAKRIIRYQHRLAKQIAASDTRLIASCHGLWSRLRYLYSLRRQRKEHPSG